MDDKGLEMAVVEGIEVSRFQDGDRSPDNKGNTSRDAEDMAYFGKRQQLRVWADSPFNQNGCIKLTLASEGLAGYQLLDLSARYFLPGRACSRTSFKI